MVAQFSLRPRAQNLSRVCLNSKFAKYDALSQKFNIIGTCYGSTLVSDARSAADQKEKEFKPLDTFPRRHIGPGNTQIQEMLQELGYKYRSDMLKDVIPDSVINTEHCKKAQQHINAQGISESELDTLMNQIQKNNKVFKSFIGMGYYDVELPMVILRNIVENPLWITSYTPYQAEISQGRLESLLLFQTIVSELTGMEIANASLLDEGTAAAEAMTLSFRTDTKKRTKFLADENMFPQTIDVLKSRAEYLGIDIEVRDIAQSKMDFSQYFAVLLQYPCGKGDIVDYTELATNLKQQNVKVIVAADLLALTLIKPPGEWGADIVVGSSQRLGVPMNYGGPHAGYFACKQDLKRKMPGRLVGTSKDRLGNPAYRLALQTREQHIRKEKATSNICTAQALLANIVTMYCVYHGPKGLKDIAKRIHGMTHYLARTIDQSGPNRVVNRSYFDTLNIEVSNADYTLKKALNEGMNLNKLDNNHVSLSIDETTEFHHLQKLAKIFQCDTEHAILEDQSGIDRSRDTNIPLKLIRKSDFLQQPVFNTHHTETKLLRFMTHLQSKDLSLGHSMIPLGSCTMKLNGTSELLPLSRPEFNGIHPFVPADQVKGYKILIDQIEEYLAAICGMDTATIQPNSGANGEFTGLLAIRGYQNSIGQGHRNISLIPVSAHGTNPASSVLAGMKVVFVECDKKGNLDLDDLKKKAELHSKNLSVFMVTYPSTFGLFEPDIQKAIEIIHENGGQVYMDGANMNAQIGLTSPGFLGADVCHLNLHKTFAIPHGGGGPGVGPCCVKKHLAPFLPSHRLVQIPGRRKEAHAVASAPFGSASILPISWAYIKLMGSEGLRQATETALLNANYMANKLSAHYSILYKNHKDRVGHEFIIDLRAFRQTCGIEATDIAKRLMDYGFHAPTLSFPVSNTLMVEPTESEDKEELDRFCDAMASIREEIREIEAGLQPRDNNVLKMAPHPLVDVISTNWDRPYSREKAAYPLDYLKEKKFWPSVARLNDAYGDQNLFCTCV